jgi:hypothetical protein
VFVRDGRVLRGLMTTKAHEYVISPPSFHPSGEGFTSFSCSVPQRLHKLLVDPSAGLPGTPLPLTDVDTRLSWRNWAEMEGEVGERYYCRMSCGVVLPITLCVAATTMLFMSVVRS